jgi:hypothetical protein
LINFYLILMVRLALSVASCGQQLAPVDLDTTTR